MNLIYHIHILSHLWQNHEKRRHGSATELIAFAPSYSEPIDIGSVLMNRQIVNGVLA